MKIRKKNIIEYATGYLFVLVPLVLIILFIAYPVIQSLVLSFFKWRGIGEWRFIGFVNYIKMFTEDRFFYTALKNSAIYSLCTTIGTIVIGLTWAIIINLGIRFWKIYRFIFFLPVVFSQIVMAMLWTRIFDPAGLFNTLLSILHLEELQRIWLGEANTALGIIISVSIWQYSGFTMLFFLAGMQNIDDSLYEAAKIDGASIMRRIFSITIPLLKNVFSVVILLQLIFSFKVFDIIWVMTRGGPAGKTEVLGTLLYSTAFQSQKFGYASVIAVIMFFIAIIYAIAYIRTSGYRKISKD